MDLLADLYFGGLLISKKKKKKKVISDIDLYALCMQVLHGDLQDIHNDFQLFSISHCFFFEYIQISTFVI